MIDLNKIVNNAMEKIESEKYVEAAMEKAIKNAIDSTINDLFGWSGKLEKQLKKELGEKLELNLGSLDIQAYNKTMVNIVDKKLNEIIKIQGTQRLQNEMDELLKSCKGSYNLSEIVKELKKEAREDYDSCELDGSEISLHIDADRTLIFVYFDTEEGKENYECKYKLIICPETNKLDSVRINETSFQEKVIMGTPHGVDGLLFKLYTGGAKVILDKGTEPEDYDIEFGYED